MKDYLLYAINFFARHRSYSKAVTRLARQSSLMTDPVSAEQQELFDQEGYLVIDSEIPVAVLDSVVEEVSALYDHWRPGSSDPERKQDAWTICRSVRSVALAPKVLSVLRRLYGRVPLPFQTLNFPVATQQPAHSDALHFNSLPPGFVAGVWIALEDIDRNNGPLIFYPGSHRLPESTLADAGAPPGMDSYPVYEKFIQREIIRHGLQPHYGILKKGRALIWASNLLHGGAPLNEKSRTRHSQVTHYFFEGCRYYTPMLSEPGKPHFRSPGWIV